MTASILLCVGDLNVDLAVGLRHKLAIGSDTDGEVRLSGGGSAANVAAWASSAGAQCRFVGPLGADHLGDYLVSEMTSFDVELITPRRLGQQTRAVAAIVGPDGNRSLVSDQNNLIALESDDLDPDWFEGVGWLHLTAYTFIAEQSRSLFSELVVHATEQGIPVSIDPSAAELLRSNCELAEVRQAFSGASTLFPSHDEAEYLSGTGDPTSAAEHLLDLADCVVVTCGADGAVVAERGQPTFSAAAHHTNLVNTLGCGDAFAAGFLAGRLTGLSTVDCAGRGLAVAAKAASLPTAR